MIKNMFVLYNLLIGTSLLVPVLRGGIVKGRDGVGDRDGREEEHDGA